MAIRWADSTFSGTPAQARKLIPEKGGWWLTTDITEYLTSNNLNTAIVSFTPGNADSIVKNSIDNNYVDILCLDMYYVKYNSNIIQHTNKFYQTQLPNWGHFLLIKGYKQVDNKLYYEIYDPYTDHESYTNGLPMGKDRYYIDTTITAATSVWWNYPIVVAPKGKLVSLSTNGLQTNSVEHIPVARGQ